MSDNPYMTERSEQSARDFVDGMHVVPMFDGGAQVESHAAGIDFEIEFDDEGKIRNVFLARAEVP